VPHSSALWMAAGGLWILDATMNISMEPFRALVADKLPDSQRSFGFVVQTLIIGVSTWVASNLPLMVSSLGVSNEAAPRVVPMSVQVAFGIGAAVFILSILYTVFTTDEYPPEDMEAFRAEQKEKSGLANTISEVFKNIADMPKTMKRLGVVQFFSWFAFFCMWSMANPALTDHVFNAAKPEAIDFAVSTAEQIDAYKVADRAFNDASNKVGSAMGNYGLSSMVFALVLTFWTAKRRLNRKFVHMFSLLVGAYGFISMYFITNPEEFRIFIDFDFFEFGITKLAFSFVCIGFSWGSILSMPYAMLSSTLDPKRMGVYMGIFNMFIVIPQIVAATSLTTIYKGVFGEDPINAMLLAGTSLVIAGLSNFLITNKKAVTYTPEG